jgi:hypothetical protein
MKIGTMICSVLVGVVVFESGCSKDDSATTQPTITAAANVSGVVLRKGTASPVAGAVVIAGGESDTTKVDGLFHFSLPAGSYQISATADKYVTFSGTITVASSAQALKDTIGLQYIPWTYVGNTIAIPGPTGWEFATGLNNTIYFATPNNTGSQQHFIAYDLSTNTYAEKSLTGNDLCACGYNSDLVTSSNKLFHFANDGTVYTPVTNTWAAANYPSANRRGESGVAVYGDDIYFVGGRGPLNTCQVYNASTNSWRSIANYLYASDWSAAVAYNGKIYVLGGASARNKMSVYTPGSNSWLALPDIPYANISSRPRAVMFDNKIFFFSGRDVYVYDLLTSSWSPEEMSTPDAYGIPVLAGTSMYLVAYSAAKSGYAILKYTP